MVKKYVKGLFVLVLFLVFQLQLLSQNQFTVIPQPVDAKLDAAHDAVVLNGPSVLMDKNKMVWCGSVVKGDDNLYHMFFSTWDCGPDSLYFGDSWVLNSEIGYAVSAYPDRGFEFKKIILRGRRYEGDTLAWDAQMVHNPYVKKFNNKYYLYFIGSMDPGKQPEGSLGCKLSKRDRVQQMQKIGVIEFSDFNDILSGNFERPAQPLLSPRTRVKKDNIINPSPDGTLANPDNIIVTNPAVTYRPSDKKYLLYFKGNWYDPVWRGIHGVAIADSPIGPFKVLDDIVFDVRMPDGKVASAEDPFVWYYEKLNQFFVVVKDFSGRITGTGPGLALLSSPDGIKWQQAKNPTFLKKELELKDGSRIKLAFLERPFLLLDNDGTPLVFYGACAVNSPFGQKITGTCNVHIPLKITIEDGQ